MLKDNVTKRPFDVIKDCRTAEVRMSRLQLLGFNHLHLLDT